MDIHNNLRAYERLSESREKVNKYIEDYPK